MKNRSGILLTFIIGVFAMLFLGCSNTKNQINFHIINPTKIMVDIPSRSETVEIIEAEIVNQITDKVNKLTFNIDTENNGYEPIKYILTWYNKNDKKIEEIMIKDSGRIKYGKNFYNLSQEGMKIELNYIEDYLYPFYHKPEGSQVTFWIKDSVSNDMFKNCTVKQALPYATEYYAEGYKEGDEEYVSYWVSEYPDYVGEDLFVKQIFVTDPSIKILEDLTAASSVDEWNAALQLLNFNMGVHTDTLDEETAYKEVWYSNDGKVVVTIAKVKHKYVWCIDVVDF